MNNLGIPINVLQKMLFVKAKMPPKLLSYFESATCGKCYICKMVEIFREVKRVMRDDSTFWLNMGDSYAGSGKGQWADGEHDPKKRKTDGMKLDHGKTPVGFKPKDLCGIPWMLAFALRADGWWLRSDIIWAKPNPMPESVRDRPTKSHEYIFLLTKSKKYYYDQDAIREPHQYDGRKDTMMKGSKKYKEFNIPGQEGQTVHERGHERWPNPSGRNKRTVWTIPTQPYPEAHFATFPEKLVEPCVLAGTSEKGCCPECGNPWVRVVEVQKSNDSTYATRGKKRTEGIGPQEKYDYNTGFKADSKSKTIGWKPTCDCGNEDTQPAIVIDPFCGSGTACKVAQGLGRNYIGIELNAEYIKLAEKRVSQGVIF